LLDSYPLHALPRIFRAPPPSHTLTHLLTAPAPLTLTPPPELPTSDRAQASQCDSSHPPRWW